MEKINIGTHGFTVPMPLCIVGTRYEGKANYMAVGWVTRVNFKPQLIGIGINKGHATNAGIRDCGEFSINFPSVDMVTISDYLGLVSAKRVDKSDLFDSYYGELKDAPLISECPLSMECKLYEAVELPTNTFFIGEIVGTWCEERFMTDGHPDIKKINPFVLTMPDNRFWSIGDQVGDAWKTGKAYKK